MDYKRKHFRQLRKAVLLTTAAVMTLGCSKDKKNLDYNSGDMLSLSEITDKDIAGNVVVLEKINIPLCDENKQITGINLLHWGIRDKLAKERSEKTYATPFYLGGQLCYVETYKDGVLKGFSSMIIADKRLQVIGDARTYARNLAEIHAQQAERERKKAMARMAERRRKRSENDDTAFVIVENDSLNDNSVLLQYAERKDTLRLSDEREIFSDKLQKDTVAAGDSLADKKIVHKSDGKMIKSYGRE